MVAEDRLIVQIEVVVADLTAGLNAFSKAVVEGGIQVIAGLTDLHDIPCMAVLDPFSGLFPHKAIIHQIPRTSHNTFTDFAIPSHTPTPCPKGPIISWE